MKAFGGAPAQSAAEMWQGNGAAVCRFCGFLVGNYVVVGSRPATTCPDWLRAAGAQTGKILELPLAAAPSPLPLSIERLSRAG